MVTATAEVPTPSAVAAAMTAPLGQREPAPTERRQARKEHRRKHSNLHWIFHSTTGSFIGAVGQIAALVIAHSVHLCCAPRGNVFRLFSF
jgi:hypothetical protein